MSWSVMFQFIPIYYYYHWDGDDLIEWVKPVIEDCDGYGSNYSKRKISEERKQQLRDQLERARAKRKPESTRMYILQFLLFRG